MIDPKLLQPHRILNEDGRSFDHPGFIEFRCPVCGGMTLKALGTPATTCGRKECDER